MMILQTSLVTCLLCILPTFGQQLVRPLGRDRRCRGDLVFQKKPADLEDNENFLNSTSFSEIDCAVKCWQRVPGCQGVRYDHRHNNCMYSSKDQGNCFRSDADPKVNPSDDMITMYCIQCVERNRTAKPEKPTIATPIAISQSTATSSQQSVQSSASSASAQPVITLSTPVSEPPTPKFAGQDQTEEKNRGPQIRTIGTEVDRNSVVEGGAEKLPVLAQQLQQKNIFGSGPGQQQVFASPAPASPPSSPSAGISVEQFTSPSTVKSTKIIQNRNGTKVSRKPTSENQTAEYDEYYYSDSGSGSGAQGNIDPVNLALIKPAPIISPEATTQPTVRKINALPIPSVDTFASSSNKSEELENLRASPPKASNETRQLVTAFEILTGPTEKTTVSPVVETGSTYANSNVTSPESQPAVNFTEKVPLEVTFPPENVQILHTFNETSGSFSGISKDPLSNASLVEAVLKNAESQISDKNATNPSIARITGQLNPIDLSSVTPDPSCRDEDVLPCSKHVGRECIVVKPGRCPLCFCPYRSPAKGCAGPSGLSDIARNELIQGKRNCPNGEAAQTVYRYERKVDKEKKFDNCIRTVQPYCGPEQDLFWQMPRFVNDCYYYCYTDKELRDRGFQNITTYDRRL